jgi:dTDP-4-dehydrorhamnose reductase
MIKFLNGNLEVLTKSNHFPNRINVEDLAGIILIAINQHKPGRIVNVTDQKSVTSYEAISYVANTLSLDKPIPVDFEKSSISEMAKSFFNTSKIVKSNVINKEFKYQYLHPDYKEALLALTKNLI